MKKHICKTLFASFIVGSGIFLLADTQAKAYFEIEQPWWHDSSTEERKKIETVEDLYNTAKKLAEDFDAKQKTAVVKVNNDQYFYTFDLTKPLEEHRKNIKVAGDKRISSIDMR